MNARYRKKLQRLRVPLGFVLAAAYIVLSRPTYVMLVSGAVIAFVGVFLRLWAAGHIEKGRRLATSGPYAWTRNPLYLGSLIIGAGFAMASRSWLIVLFFVLYFSLLYIPVMREEEQELRAAFGTEFDEYARRVPFLIPRFFPAPTDETGRDSWAAQRFDLWLVMRNREYNSILGFVSLVVLIYLKIVFGY